MALDRETQVGRLEEVVVLQEVILASDQGALGGVQREVQAVGGHPRHGVGLDVADGKLLWAHEVGWTRWVIGIATPVFDRNRILISAAAEDPPAILLEQLRVGGIMVLPVGQTDEVQQLRAENDQLKHLVAELALKNRVLKKSVLGSTSAWDD